MNYPIIELPPDAGWGPAEFVPAQYVTFHGTSSMAQYVGPAQPFRVRRCLACGARVGMNLISTGQGALREEAIFHQCMRNEVDTAGRTA